MPPMLRSCAMLERIASMVLWFSSGGTSSVIHMDGPRQNLNCLLAGSKHWLLYPPSEVGKIVDKTMGWVHTESLPEDDPLKAAYGAFTGRLDVDAVDLEKFPGWRPHLHPVHSSTFCLRLAHARCSH